MVFFYLQLINKAERKFKATVKCQKRVKCWEFSGTEVSISHFLGVWGKVSELARSH